ncbi:cadherin-like domain-containing protein [Skermanella sp. TT6]|uniref:Cadherin-like domain-containing protein n=1 Tax=Skermanella cutis TaxID=2775420 RepID=A0ABX7B536_9PROT|nr:cadherin-like domain-containing protein [Skermanella sp. TT6]QQP89228.1 cadherin-like domain-containing protein [Skermanella sp. TT6]
MGRMSGEDGSPMSLADIAQSFSVQQEATEQYPFLADPSADPEPFLRSVYKNLFNRDSIDQGGLDYWTGKIAEGRPIGLIIIDIISGAQGADAVMVENKAQVAAYYTEQYKARKAEWNLSDIDAAKAVLDGVTDDAATVESGKSAVDTAITEDLPSYAVSPAAPSADEGQWVTFILDTTKVEPGTKIAYTLTGVSAEDVVGGQLTGEFTVGEDGKASINVELVADLTTEGPETLTITLDGMEVSASATVNDTSMTPGNEGPVAGAPVVLDSTQEDGSAVIFSKEQLLANVKDAEDDVLSIVGVSYDEAAGTLVKIDEDTWSFTPAANYNGTVSFEVTVSDGAHQTVAYATLQVESVNDWPEASGPVTFDAIQEDTTLVMTAKQLLANVTDADGDNLIVTDVEVDTAFGDLTRIDETTWSFKPIANYNGPVSFVVNVSDGEDQIATSASVEIIPVNDAPVFAGVADTTIVQRAANAIFAGATVSDAEQNYAGGKLTVSIASGAAATNLDALTIGDSNVILTGNAANKSIIIDADGNAATTKDQTLIGSVTGGTYTVADPSKGIEAGYKPLVITLNDKATDELVSTLLKSVKLSADTVAERTVTVTASDANGATSLLSSAKIAVTASSALQLTGLSDDDRSMLVADEPASIGGGNASANLVASGVPVAGSTLKVELSGTFDASDVLALSGNGARVVSGFVLVTDDSSEINIGTITGGLASPLLITFNEDATDDLISTLLRNITFDATNGDGDRKVTFTLTGAAPGNIATAEVNLAVASGFLTLTVGDDTNTTFAAPGVSPTGINVFQGTVGTLNSGDEFSGGASTSDRLEVTLGSTVVSPIISKVEAFDLTSSAATGGLDFTDVSDVKSVMVRGAFATTLANIGAGVATVNAGQMTAALTASFAETSGDVSVIGSTADDTISFGATLNNADVVNGGLGNDTVNADIDGLTAETGALKIANVETVNLSATEAAATVDASGITGEAGSVRLNVSGDQEVTLLNVGPAVGSIVSNQMIDGKLNVSFAAGSGNVLVTGGNGDDTMSFGTTLNNADAVDGGAGVDTLNATINGLTLDWNSEAASTGLLNIVNVETVNLTTTGENSRIVLFGLDTDAKVNVSGSASLNVILAPGTDLDASGLTGEASLTATYFGTLNDTKVTGSGNADTVTAVLSGMMGITDLPDVEVSGPEITGVEKIRLAIDDSAALDAGKISGPVVYEIADLDQIDSNDLMGISAPSGLSIVNIGTDDVEVNAAGWTGNVTGWTEAGLKANAYSGLLSVDFGKNLSEGDKVIGSKTGLTYVSATLEDGQSYSATLTNVGNIALNVEGSSTVTFDGSKITSTDQGLTDLRLSDSMDGEDLAYFQEANTAAQDALTADLVDGTDADLDGAVTAAQQLLDADLIDGTDADLDDAVTAAQQLLDADLVDGSDADLDDAVTAAQQLLDADLVDGSDADLDDAVTAAQQLLDADLIDGSDADLDDAVTAAQQLLDADLIDGSDADLDDAVTAAQQLLDADLVDGSDADLDDAFVDAKGALASYEAQNPGPYDLDPEWQALSQAVIEAQGEVTERSDLRRALSEAQGEVTERSDLRQALSDAQGEVTERSDLRQALSEAQGEVTERSDLRQALSDAQGEVTERSDLRQALSEAQGEVTERSDLRQALSDAQGEVTERSDLRQDVTDAQKALDDATSASKSSIALDNLTSTVKEVDASGFLGKVSATLTYVGTATEKGILNGGHNDDILTGGAGQDIIRGGAGNDVIKAGAGNDIITGGTGVDELTGGAGSDTFVFSSEDTGAGVGNRDVVFDFTIGQDKIDLQSVEGVARFTDLDISVGSNTTIVAWTEMSGDNKPMVHEIELVGNITLSANDFIFGGSNPP